MGLISKKWIKSFRQIILSPKLENLLLVMYIIVFSMIISHNSQKKSGVSLGNKLTLPAYEYQHILNKFFMKEEFDKIQKLDDLYTWIEDLQTKKLWVQNRRSSNWPIGATRIVQQRVKKAKDCGSYGKPGTDPTKKPRTGSCSLHLGNGANGVKKAELGKCLTTIYSQSCNSMFTKEMEQKNQKDSDDLWHKFKAKSPNDCIIPKTCFEYTFKDANIAEYQGKYSTYTKSGFIVDLDSIESETKSTLKKLKDNNWIDQDTRAVQIISTVKSMSSLTYYNMRAVLEIPNGPLSGQLF